MHENLYKNNGGHLVREKPRCAKLTPAQVREIRDAYNFGDVTQNQLAEEYGIHHSQINRIVLRQQWKHIR